MIEQDYYWMKEALFLAEEGMKKYNEPPIASILVSNGKEIARGVSSNVRNKTVVAHGEIVTLMNAGRKIRFCDHPLVLYTTLEPCIMCIGATIEARVDKIVFGMPALPDGGVVYTKYLQGVKEKIPKIIGGIYENEQYQLMKKFIASHDETNTAFPYVQDLIDQYEKSRKLF